VSAAGDHRIAMAAAVAALSCEEPVRIDGWGSVATSYPAFLDDLAGLRRT
jgi:3-phosphoshikimate 1-carboxyvinyltransferase